MKIKRLIHRPRLDPCYDLKMIKLEEYKEALGFDAGGLSEAEILEARQIQDDLSEIFFPMWLEKRRENAKQFEVFLNETYERK